MIGTRASAGPSQAPAIHSGPGSISPSRAVNGSTVASTARVRVRISRVRPYGAVTTSASSGSCCEP